MTNNELKIREKFVRDLCAVSACDFQIEQMAVQSPGCFARLADTVTDLLADKVDIENLDPLDVELFRATNGAFIMDVTFTVGGPSISARYESRWERLTIEARHGGDRLDVSATGATLCNDVASCN